MSEQQQQADDEIPVAGVVEYQRTGGGDGLTKFDLAMLVVKGTGLYALLSAATYASYVPLGVSQMGSASASAWLITSYLIPMGVFLAIGLFALIKATMIARWVFPEFAAQSGLTVTGRDFQAAALAVVGVCLVAEALPRAMSFIASYALSGPSSGSEWAVTTIEAGAEMVIGVLLFLRGRGIARLWEKIRYGGIVKPGEADRP